MIKRDYDTMYDKNTGNTESHLAVDTQIRESDFKQNSYEEGFASASGVRNETAETGGRVRHPESRDQSRNERSPKALREENAGLADS